MAEVTVYPSLDGRVQRYNAEGEIWAFLHDGAGTGANVEAVSFSVTIQAKITDVDMWRLINRGIIIFDTSLLPDGATIISATLSLHSRIDAPKLDDLGISPTINIYGATPASETELVAADYQQLGTIAFSTSITYANWVADGYNDFILNAAGLAAILRTGKTIFGLREATYDAPDTTPSWADGGVASYIVAYSIEKGGDYAPKLTITYLSDAPTVITKAATDIEKRAAWPVGMVTDIGSGSVDYAGFDWGLTPAYGDSLTWAGSFLADVDFTHYIEDLEIGTTYHFRAKAHNEAGWGYGQDLTFITLGAAYPTRALTRVAGLIHRWRPGYYTLEMALGDITADFGTMILSPMIAVPPTPLAPLPPLPTPPIPQVPWPLPTPPLPPPVGAEPYVPTYHWLRAYYFTLSALQVGYAEYKRWMATVGKTPDTFEEYCRAVGRWDELKRLEHLANITPGI